MCLARGSLFVHSVHRRAELAGVSLLAVLDSEIRPQYSSQGRKLTNEPLRLECWLIYQLENGNIVHDSENL